MPRPPHRVRSVFGVSTGMPKRRASRSTGVTCSSMPRPAGFGARVYDGHDLVPAPDDLDQCRDREVRRAHEDEAERHSLTGPRSRQEADLS